MKAKSIVVAERKDEIRRYNRIYSRGYDAAIRKVRRMDLLVRCPGYADMERCLAMACPEGRCGYDCYVPLASVV